MCLYDTTENVLDIDFGFDILENIYALSSCSVRDLQPSLINFQSSLLYHRQLSDLGVLVRLVRSISRLPRKRAH